MIRKLLCGAGALGTTLFAATAAFAQEATQAATEAATAVATAAAEPVAEAAAATVDKGDTAWMMTSTVIVLMMILPGLALFYGGLTRSKNMLSTMTQIGAAATASHSAPKAMPISAGASGSSPASMRPARPRRSPMASKFPNMSSSRSR